MADLETIWIMRRLKAPVSVTVIIITRNRPALVYMSVLGGLFYINNAVTDGWVVNLRPPAPPVASRNIQKTAHSSFDCGPTPCCNTLSQLRVTGR